MNIAANDNLQSTPDRIRNALRDDAVKAAQDYSALPDDARTTAAYDDALAQAQPYLDFLAIAEMLRPADMLVNDAELPTPDNDTGFAVEFRHDVRPSVDEMLAAYADGMRTFVRRLPRGKVERFVGGVRYHSEDNAVTVGGRSSTGRFYGLHFYRGALVHFGQNGRRVLAVDEQTEPRGPDAANDNSADFVRETTTLPGAPQALAEIERVSEARRVLSELSDDRARLLDVIMQADSFAEVAEAAGLAPTSHNGRRVTAKLLGEAKKLLAA